jgi:signal transduction histidine kinase
LWFTTAKGVVSVQSHEIRPKLPPPPVLIEEVVVDGKVIVPKFSASSSSPFAPIGLTPGNHRVEFRYTGLSLASAERVQFKYRLEGVSEEWAWAGTRRAAEYSLLPSGDYRFQVLACNSDNIWSLEASSLDLRIPPRFYETAWFRVLAGTLAACLIAGTMRHRVTVKLLREMEQLERLQAIERERARIARDIHDDLGTSLTLIATLGDFVSRQKPDEIVWAVNPRNDTLGHLIDYAGQFAVDYLRAAGIRCLLDVPPQVPESELPSNVRHNIFLVIKESLQNVVKHARASEVWLRFSFTPEGVRVVIEDNGSGFEQAPENALADGLRNMRQRMSEISGDCRIESRMGGGTTIILELAGFLT